MSKQDIKSVLGQLMKNRTVLVAIGFSIWMLIIDSEGLFYRYNLNKQLSLLEQERDKLKESIQLNHKKMEDLKSSKECLEKFAREEYFMKKDNETIFIVK